MDEYKLASGSSVPLSTPLGIGTGHLQFFKNTQVDLVMCFK